MNLHDPSPDIYTCEPSTSSSCEACGEAFTCGAQLSGCWCTEVKVSEAVRADLRTRYQRCLCRACLEHFAESYEESVADTRSASPGGAVDQ